MEMPGPKTLFSRITLTLHAESSVELRYRARAVHSHRQALLPDTELIVAGVDGTLVATATLCSHVPSRSLQAVLPESASRAKAADLSQATDPGAAGESKDLQPCTSEPAERKGAERYRPEDEAEVLAFQRLAFPTRQAEMVQPRWRWMFEESATRLGVPMVFWLYRDRGAVVGQTGLIPVRLKVADLCLQTGWVVETMVVESHRGRGVGPRIFVRIHRDQPFSLSLGQTVEMREIQLRLGWKQVASMQIAQRVLRAENVLRARSRSRPPGPQASDSEP